MSGAAIAGLAGCLGRTVGPSGRTTTDAPPTTDEEPTTDAPASTPPRPASDVFADVECPSFDDSADRTVCYHAVDPAETDVLLTVDPEVFDPGLGDDTVEELHFTLHNQSEWHFQFNPYAWGIERREDDEWVHVAPDAVPEPLTAIPPGSTYTWTMPSERHPTDDPDRTMYLDLALEAGVYAFHVSGFFGIGFDPATATPTAEPPDERVECVGLVRLDDDVDPSTSGEPPKTTATGSRPDEPVTSTNETASGIEAG